MSDSQNYRRLSALVRSQPQLVGEEEKALFEDVARGSISARNRILASYMRLALSCAKSLCFDDSRIDDAFSTGCIALAEAIKNHKDGPASNFGAYARIYVNGAIREFLATDGAPVVGMKYHHSTRKAINLGRKIDSDPSGEIRLTDAEREMVDAVRRVFHGGVFDDDVVASIAVDSFEDDVIEKVSSQAVRRNFASAFAALPERERAVLRLRYGRDNSLPYSEIAVLYGVTPQRVQHIEQQAITRLTAWFAERQSRPGHRVTADAVRGAPMAPTLSA